MTTRETPSPSWRDSENLPLEFDAGTAGDIVLGGAGVEGSGAGTTAARSGMVALTCGNTASAVVAFGSGRGGGVAAAGAAGFTAGAGTGALADGVLAARRKSTTRR